MEVKESLYNALYCLFHERNGYQSPQLSACQNRQSSVSYSAGNLTFFLFQAEGDAGSVSPVGQLAIVTATRDNILVASVSSTLRE
jgi:4'-phosphopantetheinyl transferase EntD